MMKGSKPVALVVGASSGFGKDVSKVLNRKGFKVYSVARRTSQMKDLKRGGISIGYMDVADNESVVTCVEKIIKREGCIDVLINNAGYGAYGMIECVPMEDVIRQFDVNVFGAARVNNAVLPHMRRAGKGRIIITSSMASHVTTLGSGWYCATKHAIKAMSEALRMEVADLGIFVSVIEPGPVKTGFEDATKISYQRAKDIKDYAKLAAINESYMKKTYKTSPGTKSTVKAMVRAAIDPNPKPVYKTTLMSKVLPLARNIMGIGLYSKILRYLYSNN